MYKFSNLSNDYFKFKQFVVKQDRAAMKVCTDACIFGAWISKKIAEENISIKNCLDIGTGTGLLSLMLAQKNNIKIDAVEINAEAFQQAKENFENSPWIENLTVLHSDIRDLSISKKYDLIISNPPFFENVLQSDSQQKNYAKHENGLDFKTLLHKTSEHLNPDGYLAVLLPFKRLEYFKELAQLNNFYIKDVLCIRQTFSHGFFRAILLCRRAKEIIAEKELIIKNEAGNYTEKFIELLKDYYLKL